MNYTNVPIVSNAYHVYIWSVAHLTLLQNSNEINKYPVYN